MPEHSIEKVKDDLHRALDNAERTRKRTGSSEDRSYVILITDIVVSLWGESPERRELSE